jgi:hypothetical protein
MLRLLFLLLLQDPDQIHRLGDADVNVREKAYKALEARGDTALPELTRALEDADPEVRLRAEILIDIRAQEKKLAELMRTQRPAKLKLAEIPREYDFPQEIVETEGLRFTFSRRPWAPEGNLLGTVYSSELSRSPGVETEWRVTSVRDGRDLPLETCSYHSPNLVYVPGAAPKAPEVRVQGTRRWYCDVPLLLRNPSDGMTRRIGGYTVTVLWPVVRVRSDKPLPENVMGRVLQDADVTCKVRPECVDNCYFGFGRGCGSGCRARRTGKLAWCGCPGEPRLWDRDPEPLSSETEARDLSAQRYDIAAIESIALTLHLPVDEPFEVTSPPLK